VENEKKRKIKIEKERGKKTVKVCVNTYTANEESERDKTGC
jgi:hypothetical protein